MTLEFTDTSVATGGDMLVTGTSFEVGEILTHLKMESDSSEVSDDVSTVLALPLDVPPVTEAIKKDHIDVEASNIETLCKSEPDIIRAHRFIVF